MQAGNLIYKCRVCGNVFKGAHVPDGIRAMAIVMCDAPMPESWDGSMLDSTTICNCNPGKIGIADLIGFEEYKEAHSVNPIKNINDLNRLRDYLENNNKRDYLIFSIILSTGLRTEDVVNLRVRDVVDTTGEVKDEVYIPEKKTNKERRIFLNNKLKIEIQKYIINKKSYEYLFSSIKDSNKPISVNNAIRSMNYATNKIGIQRIGKNTLRKTFAYHAYQEVKDIAIIQRILGIQDSQIALRYIGTGDDIYGK